MVQDYIILINKINMYATTKINRHRLVTNAVDKIISAPDSEERSSRYRRRSLRAWHPRWAVAPFKMDLDASHGLGMTDPP
jgi:transposase-like protein